MDGVAAKLERLKREVRKEWKAKWRNKLRQAAPANAAEWRALAAEAAGAALKVVLIIALPFAVLVRGSVFIYEHGTRSVWLAVATAGILSGGVITAYAVWIARKFMKRGVRGGRALVIPVAKWVALPLVLFYCGYSLIYLASVHAKSAPVRAYYRSVHPLLRLWTDRPASRMTLHDQLALHAVDLRTTGRGVIKNRGVQFYFWLMGFDTRRHVGTADHLHVELN